MALDEMRVSVIISTYNSPDWLEKVLWGYQNQTIDDFEVVIADDGSDQKTGELIDGFTKTSAFKLKHIRHEDDGFRKWQIVNCAIKAASGDYLIFTDGDCIPAPDLVQTHIKLARSGHFLSGGYCKLPMSTSTAITRNDIASAKAFTLGWLRKNGYGISAKWLKIILPGTPFAGLFNRLSPAAKTFNGNNSSCFRKDALSVNGFDERILYGGGDREFGYRLENAGIKPIIKRYSSLCLHLDHPRGYKSDKVREANMAIIAKTKETGCIRTDHGIDKP